jgi:hypothetical protein
MIWLYLKREKKWDKTSFKKRVVTNFVYDSTRSVARCARSRTGHVRCHHVSKGPGARWLLPSAVPCRLASRQQLAQNVHVPRIRGKRVRNTRARWGGVVWWLSFSFSLPCVCVRVINFFYQFRWILFVFTRLRWHRRILLNYWWPHRISSRLLQEKTARHASYSSWEKKYIMHMTSLYIYNLNSAYI